MANYVVTNIRLTKEELYEYRLMALEAGMSFPALVRMALRAHHRKPHKRARKAPRPASRSPRR
jgi:hypothetical protein